MKWVVFFPILSRFATRAGGRCIAEKPPVGLGWDKSEIKPARPERHLVPEKRGLRRIVVC